MPTNLEKRIPQPVQEQSPMSARPPRRLLANAIRVLSMDAVQKANSGHPGMPMGMADIGEVLWNDFLVHNPADPHWINRDRFILSNGHGCMLQYSLLHFSGYDLSMEDIKQFRQLHARTPGHPEFGLTPGVEATTGPLGQGIADGVGMAIAEKVLAGQFNRPNLHIIDHYTYVFMGDGDMMEGISHEACALAGTLGLGKLIAFWDDNDISIDGHVGGWFTDDTAQRFTAYGWHVQKVDGHDPEQIRQAILQARSVNNQPSLICCKTTIGYGAPNLAGSHDSHGSPLGVEEVAATRKNLNWNYAPFEIPSEIYQAFDARIKGNVVEANWQDKFTNYQKQYPELAAEFSRRIHGELPKEWPQKVEEFIKKIEQENKSMATRKASQVCLNTFGLILPELLGGSADLTGSNYTDWSGSKALSKTVSDGNYIHYGVREFGMFAIMNGIALHGGFIPYGGTFLTFVDYGRNAVRLCAMMKQRVIFVLTHDSIGLGEDGPTHQSVEHAAILRLTPGVSVWRPADAVETACAWQFAIEHQGPTCLLLTRQNVPAQKHESSQLSNIKRGAYILQDCVGTPDVILIATGSEVALALAAAAELTKQNKNVRLISMPSTTQFDLQDASYKEAILPSNVTARIAIEAGISDFWYKYVGLQGKVIGLNRFGESAPAADVFKYFGFTVENVIKTAKEFFASH
jgi:transketolase